MSIESQYRKWLYNPEAHMRKPSNLHPVMEAALSPFAPPSNRELFLETAIERLHKGADSGDIAELCRDECDAVLVALGAK